MTKTIRISRALIGIALLTSCRNYEPKPLALDASERAFLVRTIDAPTLAQYSAQLGARASAANAFNAADGLSLDEAELIALVFNRQLRLARLEAGVTAATAENAGLWRDPRLGVDLSQIVDGVTGGVEAMVSLGLTLPLSGRLELEKQQAQAQHRAELVRVAQQEWTVVADLRRAWVRHASLAAESQAAGDFLVRVAQVTAIVDRMESAGEIARIEARLFRIEDAKLRGQLQAIESDLTRTMHEIESLIGMPPRSDRNFDADFAFADALGRGHHDALILRLSAGSPSLAVARAEYESSELRLAREMRAQWPDLEIAPGFGEQDGQRQGTLGIGVTLPIIDGNRRAIAEAEAAREVSRGRAEMELERLISALLGAEERLAAAARRRVLLETTLLPLVDTQYAEAREVARLGEVNTLVLLESLKQQLEAKQQLIAARRDESLAAIDIEEIAGPQTSMQKKEDAAP